jgi:hypothetical protein
MAVNWWRKWQERRADARAVREVVNLNRQWGWSARVTGNDRYLASLQAAAERAAARSHGGRKADAQMAAEHLARQRAADQTHRRQEAQLHAHYEQAAREREAARRPILKIGTVRDEPARTFVEGWAFGSRPSEPEGENRLPDGRLDTRDLGWSVSELRQIAREAREHQAAQAAYLGLEPEAGD